jgi:hypothetical protein
LKKKKKEEGKNVVKKIWVQTSSLPLRLLSLIVILKEGLSIRSFSEGGETLQG